MKNRDRWIGRGKADNAMPAGVRVHPLAAYQGAPQPPRTLLVVGPPTTAEQVPLPVSSRRDFPARREPDGVAYAFTRRAWAHV